MAKRPRQIGQHPALTKNQIETATYVGSPEHKALRWWGGLPKAYIGEDGTAERPNRLQTTICPLTTSAQRDQASQWVKEALERKQFKYYEGDKDFPKYIWYCDQDGQNWIGRCVNGIQGTYKGWPVDEEERLALFG